MAELTRRYVVMTMASEAPFDPADPEGVFVLKPWKDPAALRALRTYRDHCYPELARDLDAWIAVIVAGPTVHGDVGRKNEQHAQQVAATKALAASLRRSHAKTTSGHPAKPRARRPRKATRRRRR
jgi:hypothetical protein